MRATGEPVVPFELLLDTGSYCHGLGRQVLVNPFHNCGAEEAHVMHVWMSRMERLRLSIPLYAFVLWHTRPAPRTQLGETKTGSAEHPEGTRHLSKTCPCSSKEIEYVSTIGLPP